MAYKKKPGDGMDCQVCLGATTIINSRARQGYVYRMHQCLSCGARSSSREIRSTEHERLLDAERRLNEIRQSLILP
jgi:hypothetical protein